MNGIKYNKINEGISQDCKIVRYGRYTYSEDDSELKMNVVKSIDEYTFYKIYLELNNIIGVKHHNGDIIKTHISDAPAELLIHLMLKGSDYTLVFRNKDAKLIKLGKEINKSSSSVYASLGKLRKAGYLIKDEDNLLVLNDELSYLVKNTKSIIKSGKALPFDFVFKFCVTDK